MMLTIAELRLTVIYSPPHTMDMRLNMSRDQRVDSDGDELCPFTKVRQKVDKFTKSTGHILSGLPAQKIKSEFEFVAMTNNF